MISCPSRDIIQQNLLKMKVEEIKNMIQIPKLEGWFFIATLLTSPQTMIVQQQIRQAAFVFQPERPQQLLVVIFTQPAVRKYCNQLRPFSTIKFINGAVLKSYLNNIYVLITKQSTLQFIEFKTSHQSKDFQVDSTLPQADPVNFSNKNEEPNKSYSINTLLQIYDNSASSEQSQQYLTTKSEKVYVKRQNINVQLVTFCGNVLGFYEVGKGKINHGIGYRIQQCFSKLNYEVVIWSDMKCQCLKPGGSYEFSNFRPHRKHSLQISYHSHPQYSSITPLV